MNTRPIRFLHRGAVVELHDAAPTRTVLDWLREDARCTGTKEGCAEGDCGACTVVIGEAEGDRLTLKPVNACIRFLPTLDGKALFTVEDLKPMAIAAAGACGGARSPTLHPVQQSLVDCHGSQCGFCTPGFVMSLWATYEREQAAGRRPTRQQLADDLAGNLCRCTGYRPILDAGEQMFEAPAVRLDPQPVLQALATLAADPPLNYRDSFHAPRSLADFAALRAARPEARLLAGATDMGLWVTKQFRDLGELIYIGEVAELKTIAEHDGVLEIGAAATLEDAWQALAARWPSLREVGLRFAGPPVRHAGTMGGNVANGSPIGDSAPVLMALDARIVLQRADAVREMPLADFYVDYMKNRLEPGEFVHSLRVPLPRAGEQLRAYKISKRFDCDISALCAGLAITLDGDTVREARFAFGGMAAIVKHAVHAEAAVRGRPWTQATVNDAVAALAQDFRPLSDMRASAGYRLQVAGNLLRRLWLETRPQDPLPAQALSVWSTLAQPAGEAA